jgi:GNAT superfamily N-acetyltransferase
VAITFKRLTACKIEEAITAWNRGFEGYFVKMEMTPELFFNRLVNEGLSLRHSLIGYDGDEPVAIVLNGIRIIDGKKTVWNGGTGVAPVYRGKGVSSLLMEETLKVYTEEGIEVATLEAIKNNEKAIRLYQKAGYEITDTLVYLTGTPEIKPHAGIISSQTIRPEQLAKLPIYKENVPWQCQWQSAKTGEAKVYYDAKKEPIGYALYKRLWNEKGELEKVFLYQFQLTKEISGELVDSIFADIVDNEMLPVNFMTINASMQNPTTQYLLENGFTISTEQVRMLRKM